MGEETAFGVFAARLTADSDRNDRDAAARELLSRYSAGLISLARRQMSPRLATKVAPEDVLQSVLRTFFRRLEAGEFQPRGWAGLWGYLSLTTLRKCQRNAARYATAKRNATREISLQIPGDVGDVWELSIPDRAPTPEEQATFLDELEHLLSSFGDRDRAAAEMVLSGAATSAVAQRLNCSERTVFRVLELLQKRTLARQRRQD